MKHCNTSMQILISSPQNAEPAIRGFNMLVKNRIDSSLQYKRRNLYEYSERRNTNKCRYQTISHCPEENSDLYLKGNAPATTKKHITISPPREGNIHKNCPIHQLSTFIKAFTQKYRHKHRKFLVSKNSTKKECNTIYVKQSIRHFHSKINKPANISNFSDISIDYKKDIRIMHEQAKKPRKLCKGTCINRSNKYEKDSTNTTIDIAQIIPHYIRKPPMSAGKNCRLVHNYSVIEPDGFKQSRNGRVDFWSQVHADNLLSSSAASLYDDRYSIGKGNEDSGIIKVFVNHKMI